VEGMAQEKLRKAERKIAKSKRHSDNDDNADNGPRRRCGGAAALGYPKE